LVGDGGVEGEHAITKDHEVRTGGEAVDGIGGGGIAGIVMGASGSGEVSAGRESHDADPGGIDAIRSGPAAGETQRTLGILERDGVLITFAAQPVVEHVGGDAKGVEKAGGLDAFMVLGQSAITATGADHDRAAIGWNGVGFVEIEGGLMVLGGAFGFRRAVRPEEEPLGLRSAAGKGKQAKQKQQ
jgi:hypothetical protein